MEAIFSSNITPERYSKRLNPRNKHASLISLLAFSDIRCQGQSERNARGFQVQQIGCLHGESNFKSSDILASHILDLIELDGTVSASQNVGDPTIDTADHILSWLVVLRSWENDDKLMMRIRYPRPPNRVSSPLEGV